MSDSVQNLIAEPEDKGTRIDKYLSQELEDVSRSRIQKLLDDGDITVDDKCVKSNYKLNGTEHITITIPELIVPQILPENIPLNIIYEDDDVILIDKPKGMVVHPAAGHYSGTLVNAIMYHCQGNLSGINGVMRPGIVHRIDKDTSGLLAVAKNDLAHTVLASQLKDHTLARTYEAVVCGNLKEDRGTVDAPIRCHLETGRTHQIRVHMASLGHPILGDLIYGRKKPELGQDSQCLHASTLCFRHPRTGLPVIVTAPLPRYFQEVLEKLERMGR